MTNKVLVLKVVSHDMRPLSPDAKPFIYPEIGHVEALDFNPSPVCGQGLHGFLWGEGDGGLISGFFGQNPDDPTSHKWLVIEVENNHELINLNGKVKFRSGNVIHVGNQLTATDYIARNIPSHGPISPAIIGATAKAGNHQVAVTGYRGHSISGENGKSVTGDCGTATAGDSGTATAGDQGTATAGDYGTATAGMYGTATAGNHGTATAGDCGTATAGEGGTIMIRYWDGKRYRTAVGYVGEVRTEF